MRACLTASPQVAPDTPLAALAMASLMSAHSDSSKTSLRRNTPVPSSTVRMLFSIEFSTTIGVIAIRRFAGSPLVPSRSMRPDPLLDIGRRPG